MFRLTSGDRPWVYPLLNQSRPIPCQLCDRLWSTRQDLTTRKFHRSLSWCDTAWPSSSSQISVLLFVSCYLDHLSHCRDPDARETMKIIFKSPGGHLWSQCCTFEEASANLVHPKVQHYFLSVSTNMVHPKAWNHFLLFEITNCSFFTFTILQWFAFICYQIEKCHQCNGRRVAHCSEETLSETMVGFSCSSFHTTLRKQTVHLH